MEAIVYEAVLSTTTQAAERAAYYIRNYLEEVKQTPPRTLELLDELTSVTKFLHTLGPYGLENIRSKLVLKLEAALTLFESIAEDFVGEIRSSRRLKNFESYLTSRISSYILKIRERKSDLINNISQSKATGTHSDAPDKYHEKKNRSRAIKILPWLVKAKRALTLDELLTAISVERDQYQYNKLNLPDKTILEAYRGLVIINKGTVSLSHKMFKEHLFGRSVVSTDSNLELTIACITFLLYDVFSEGACDSPTSFDDRCRLYPFLLYAAPNLSFHLAECGRGGLPMELIFRFLGSSGNMSSYWQVLRNSPESQWHQHIQFPKSHVSLHVAATLGVQAVVQHFLEGVDVRDLDDRGWKLVCIASFWGHVTILPLLVEWGIDLSIPNIDGMTVLHSAAASGNEPAVALLIENDADISAKDNKGLTALDLAAIGGHESVVSLLLENGAGVSSVDITGGTALHKAAIGGHESVVSLLLEWGADISAPDVAGETALHKAAIGGHGMVVSLLLEMGAEASSVDNIGETALHKAAIAGHESTVLRLLVKGADPKVTTNTKKKAIQLAEEGGHVSVVQLLKKGLCVVYKLETDFYDGWVLHRRYPGGYATSHTRFDAEEKWVRDRVIGTGGSATVYLEIREEEDEEEEFEHHRVTNTEFTPYLGWEDEGVMLSRSSRRENRVRAVKELPRAKNKRYAEELNALAQLIDHPDLFVRFFGWYENNESIFIAMEYIEYGDLARYIKADDRKARSRAKTIARQILHGLIFLHDKNICHRDLKPQNVLVASLEPLRVKITDFGISKSSEDMSTHTGTYPYMAPEILGVLPKRFRQKSRYTKMVDIWAFGCLIYEVLTLETPFFLRSSFETARKSSYAETTRESIYTYTASHNTSEQEDPTFKLPLTALIEYCDTETFPDNQLKGLQISQEGIEFIKSLLAVDPKSRISARDALASRWLGSVQEEAPKELPQHSNPHIVTDDVSFMDFEDPLDRPTGDISPADFDQSIYDSPPPEGFEDSLDLPTGDISSVDFNVSAVDFDLSAYDSPPADSDLPVNPENPPGPPPAAGVSNADFDISMGDVLRTDLDISMGDVLHTDLDITMDDTSSIYPIPQPADDWKRSLRSSEERSPSPDVYLSS